MIAGLLAGSWRAEPPAAIISSEELSLLAPLLLKSGAASLAWWRIRDLGVSECGAAVELKSAYHLHSLQAAIHRSEIEEVIQLLNSERIEPVLVKGWAVARLYPEEGLRPYGDIDLCFEPDQYSKAAAALERMGPRRRDVDAHAGFSKLDTVSSETIFERSEPVGIGKARFRVLRAEDQLRILCTHLLRHSAWRPLWLCDIGAAVESRPVSFDWELCLGSNKRVADWVACAIGLAHQLLGARVADTPIAARTQQLPKWLLPAVLRNWDQPFPERYPPLSYIPPMTAYLRHPRGVMKALWTRWPDPIEATLRLNGPFNELPRLPFQIGSALFRVLRFLTRTQPTE